VAARRARSVAPSSWATAGILSASSSSSSRRELVDRAGRYRDLGTGILNVRTRHRDLEHYLEQLQALAGDVIPLVA
jgi:hypothetical protein